MKSSRIIFQEINYASGSLCCINVWRVLDTLFNMHKPKHQVKKKCKLFLRTIVWKIFSTDEFVGKWFITCYSLWTERSVCLFNARQECTVRAGQKINIENQQVENTLVCGKNGVPVSLVLVAGSVVDICYTHVIGLCWGWLNLPLTELCVSVPPLPKHLLAIKNPPGSCNDSKGKQNGNSKCSLEFQCPYNIQQKAKGRETC